MLEAWIVFGGASASKAEHMQDSWRAICELDQDCLPTEAELDRNAVMDWAEYEKDFVGDPAVEGGADIVAALVPPDHAAGDLLLGEPHPDVPEAVHKTMLEMARSGLLSVTTRKQRDRQKKNGKYRVPPGNLDQALLYNYIGPNLPAPTGYVWRCKGTTWCLFMRGG